MKKILLVFALVVTASPLIAFAQNIYNANCSSDPWFAVVGDLNCSGANFSWPDTGSYNVTAEDAAPPSFIQAGHTYYVSVASWSNTGTTTQSMSSTFTVVTGVDDVLASVNLFTTAIGAPSSGEVSDAVLTIPATTTPIYGWSINIPGLGVTDINGFCVTDTPGDCAASYATSLQRVVDNAQDNFTTTTDPPLSTYVSWSAANFYDLFLGSGLAVLIYLRGWIVAIIMILAVIFFAYRMFLFFRH